MKPDKKKKSPFTVSINPKLKDKAKKHAMATCGNFSFWIEKAILNLLELEGGKNE